MSATLIDWPTLPDLELRLKVAEQCQDAIAEQARRVCAAGGSPTILIPAHVEAAGRSNQENPFE